MKITLKYIVAGTGRCGTVSLSKFLTSVGISCGHESVFTTKGLPEALWRLNNSWAIENSGCLDDISSEIKAESSFMSVPFLEHSFFKNTTVIHIVRHPVETINSLINQVGYFIYDNLSDYDLKLKPYQKFINSHYPEVLSYNTPANRAAAYYIACNERIGIHKTIIFHPIERDFQLLLNSLGLQGEYYFNKNTNHWRSYDNTITLADIDVKLRIKLYELMERYGYIKAFL